MKSVWDRLEKEFHADPTEFGGVITLEEVKKAEKTLGLTFAHSYKEFLIRYGSAGMPGHHIYGLIPLDDMDKDINTVTSATKFYKEFQKWPDIESWYVISDDGRGNPIGIDPAGVVWLSDHDAGFEKVKLANNFEEFLDKLLANTLYQD